MPPACRQIFRFLLSKDFLNSFREKTLCQAWSSLQGFPSCAWKMDVSEDSYAWSLRSQLSSLLLVFCICPAGSLHLSLPAFCILSGSSSWGSGLSYVLCTWSAELMRKWWSRQGAPRCAIYVHYTMYNGRYKINIIQRMVYLQWWYNYGWTLQKLFAYDMEELPQLDLKSLTYLESSVFHGEMLGRMLCHV